MTEALLRVSGLTVRFGGLVAVDDASLEVRPGEIKGLIGPNGAGKTTLFNAVSGLVPVSSGDIVLDGVPITHLPAHLRARRGLRRTFQSVQLVQNLTVLENVAIGLDAELNEGWLAVLFGRGGRGSAEFRMQNRVYEVLDDLGLGEFALSLVGTLTFAQQRYVEIARALVRQPRLLMLDEPAAGLTPAEVQALDRLLIRLCRSSGIAILLVEHVMELVFKVCDRISVLDSGRIIAAGTPPEVAQDPRVKVAYLGADADAPA
jgi:branched-chain amino acid transport system ATP-binding protein